MKWLHSFLDKNELLTHSVSGGRARERERERQRPSCSGGGVIRRINKASRHLYENGFKNSDIITRGAPSEERSPDILDQHARLLTPSCNLNLTLKEALKRNGSVTCFQWCWELWVSPIGLKVLV